MHSHTFCVVNWFCLYITYIARLPVLGEGSLLCCSPWGFSIFFTVKGFSWSFSSVDVSRCVFLYQQEHFYDHQSGSGYLAWRLKTVQRNSAQDSKKSRTTFQEGPKTPRSIRSDEKQLTGDECREAISVMKHSSDTTLVKNKMKATFQYRQKMVQDPDTASTVLDLFPRFLDTPGLVNIKWIADDCLLIDTHSAIRMVFSFTHTQTFSV